MTASAAMARISYWRRILDVSDIAQSVTDCTTKTARYIAIRTSAASGVSEW
ncbi:hypothetical protein [Phyllobacterium sp.]|uniref:hypothetical protein n=1 Tax=Phyllobacterium sp. TaxID=1871046 RepID=UPI0030F496AB